MEKRHIELTPTERTCLLDIVSKGTQPVKTYKRAQGLLAMDEGKTLQSVRQQVGVSYQTVSKWRNAFLSERLSMLFDKQRPGRPVEINGLQRAKITALACSEAPQGHGRWTLRLLASKVVELGYCAHMSHTEAGEILKKTS
jgi:transposase